MIVVGIDPGAKYGRLTVLGLAGRDAAGRQRWLCRCDCGSQRVISSGDIRRKHKPTRSCGCLRAEVMARANLQHGHANVRNGNGSPEWNAWASMRKRCTNPRHEFFHLYGGRGITVCKRWDDFSAFLADMGARPSPEHSLDRSNNDGNYEPSNCRWATRSEQARNKHHPKHGPDGRFVPGRVA